MIDKGKMQYQMNKFKEWFLFLNTFLKCERKNIVTGPLNKFASRILGFSLYVSNTTNKSEGIHCYKESFCNTNTVSKLWNVECHTHGQYVIFYNERVKGVTYPDDYSTYAYNDLCELKVFGKYYLLLFVLVCIVLIKTPF